MVLFMYHIFSISYGKHASSKNFTFVLTEERMIMLLVDGLSQGRNCHLDFTTTLRWITQEIIDCAFYFSDLSLSDRKCPRIRKRKRK